MTETLDITPDPKILLALTHTPIKPLDALCELLDNAIDALRAARLQGLVTAHPLVAAQVPGESEVRRGEGYLRVLDNGPGLARDELRNALRAGYSGNPNRYDTLGLFGMGFNIATGKLGRRTVVITAREEDDAALRAVIDLPQVARSRSFEIPVDLVKKPDGLSHGTIVDVSEWWTEGDPNAGFIVQLSRISKPKVRELLGRRYATLLRPIADQRFRMLINEETVVAYRPCIWSKERFVERAGWGMIPAVIEFSETIHTELRCLRDGSAIEGSSTECLECGGTEFRQVDEKIVGWVGVQRFDDNNRFGIDLIRNGRAIKQSEKDAFFNFVDEYGESIREYPIDQQSGRIVGEVHLNHVPVDFQKQDFQRSSEEWQRALEFLRGGSLLPSRWVSGERNETPVSRIFQGYRKVRNFGRPDLYMGMYDPSAGKAVRISREVERDLLERFERQEPGYIDDSRWWEYVENATVPMSTSLVECPTCGFQNTEAEERCEDCGAILKGKSCISCGSMIVASATSCPDCGASQVPEVEEPWKCEVCSWINSVDNESCERCEAIRGSAAPTSLDALLRDSQLREELSFRSQTFQLASGKYSEPLDVSTYSAGALKPEWEHDGVPSLAFKSHGRIDLFLDLGHVVFTELALRPEEAVATEAAQYLFNLHVELQGRRAHSIGNLASLILLRIWGELLVATPEKVRAAIGALFREIPDRLEPYPGAADFYAELNEHEQLELAEALVSSGVLPKLSELISSGGFLAYVSPRVLAKYFRHSPERWFGAVFVESLPLESEVGSVAARSIREQLVEVYGRCLEDCASYLRIRTEDRTITRRVRASLEYLEAKMA